MPTFLLRFLLMFPHRSLSSKGVSGDLLHNPRAVIEAAAQAAHAPVAARTAGVAVPYGWLRPWCADNGAFYWVTPEKNAQWEEPTLVQQEEARNRELRVLAHQSAIDVGASSAADGRSPTSPTPTS